MGSDVVKLAAEHKPNTELPLKYYNSQFLGTFERNGRICDYYLAFTDAGTIYFYVPRDEAGKKD